MIDAMRIGITGAAGGIGSALSDALIIDGHELVLIDNLSYGSIKNFRIKKNSDELRNIDILNFSETKDALENCEVIIHLAAISSLADCQGNFRFALENNVIATNNVSQIALQSGSKLIFASTSAIYEGNTQIPFSEKSIPNPHLIYPLTKMFSENIIHSLSKTNNLEFVSLRFFNVFAPNQSFSRKNPPLINYLVREKYLERRAKIFANLDTTRDYVYVNEIIDLIKIILSKDIFPKQSVNVSSGKSTSLTDILSAVSDAFGSDVKFDLGKPELLWENHPDLFVGKFPLNREFVRKETLKESLGDPELAFKIFGWKSSISIRDAIHAEKANMIENIKNAGILAV